MRIRKVNELFKKSYLSAYNKLRFNHPGRAARLRKWGEEGGISEPVERVWPHEFKFSEYGPPFKDNDLFHGKFFITGCELRTGLNSSYAGIDVYLKSDYAQDIKISFTIQIPDQEEDDKVSKIEWCVMELMVFVENFRGEVKWEEFKRVFLFNNRKDAIQFRRYLTEEAADELGFDYLKPGSISINKLYSTD